MKTTAKHIFASAALALSVVCLSSRADDFHFDFNGTNGTIGVIPDNNIVGLTDVRDIGSSNLIDSSFGITNVTLTLDLSGGAVSDLTGYLRLGNQTNSPAIFFNPDSPTFSLTFTNFYGWNPNDMWTLFLADTSPVDESTLVNWSLDIAAVPEPGSVALLALAGLVAMQQFVSRRRESIRTGLRG